MLTCEICGKPIKGQPITILIGGAKLTVCNECSRYGTPIKTRQISQTQMTPAQPRIQSKPSSKTTQRKFEKDIFNENIKVIDEYPLLIKSARERLGWTQDFLASQLGEKVSVIKKIETGSIVPSIQLARKIEKVLGIPLIENIPPVTNLSQNSVPADLTLGDIAKLKTPKKTNESK
ncbi:MAG: multiprotein bridging factor aMBF1 [Thermoprotei archaeon]